MEAELEDEEFDSKRRLMEAELEEKRREQKRKHQDDGLHATNYEPFSTLSSYLIHPKLTYELFIHAAT